MAHRLAPDRRNPRRERRNRVFAAIAMLLGALFTAPLLRAGETESGAEQLESEALSGSGDTDGPVVPERSSPIRFSHERHDTSDCGRCHAEAASSTTAADDLTPGMQVCADCHAAGGESETSPDAGPTPRAAAGPAPEMRNCSGCHVGYEQSLEAPVDGPEDWRSVEPPPMIPPRPESRVAFDHAEHLKALRSDDQGEDASCGRCHGSADGVDGGGEPSLPTLSTCRECHAEEADRAPEGSLKPSNHTVDWLQRHGTVARANSEACQDCHTEDECADCHEEEAAEPFTVHPPNFDTLHAVDARSNLDDCAECHTIQTFCRRCHAETKFAPDEPDRPPPRFDMHPPNWTQPGAPNNHAVMARRNIEDCASCHTERDCVSCHRGVNPHPPEFRLKCKQWLESNPAPCAKCHGNLGELRRKCL